jgi:hypothetical protein
MRRADVLQSTAFIFELTSSYLSTFNRVNSVFLQEAVTRLLCVYNLSMPDPLPLLTDINLDDLVNSVGWQGNPGPAKMLRMIFHGAANKFARQMIEYDRMVATIGLADASRLLAKRYVRDIQVFGTENIPATGPILVLSNHPGMSDTLCLFTAINRPDLRSIALDRPFLQSLPNISQHLFFVGEQTSERMSAVKKAATHLRNGGAVLTFPAGRIEPDPDVYPGALESLDDWTDSAGVFMRLAPETRIVPVLVRNVLWSNVVKNPITKLKHDRVGREKLGAAFQLLAHVLLDLHPLEVKVQFSKPLTLSEIGSDDLPIIHAAVLARMCALIFNPSLSEGISIL